MTEILEEIHYMPHLWKEKPHTVQVSEPSTTTKTIAHGFFEKMAPKSPKIFITFSHTY